jgi:hypothetical protein
LLYVSAPVLRRQGLESINDWKSQYPASQSGDNVVNATGKSCQLCHKDSSGGDPWNAYGWDLRTNSIDFVTIEPFDSDNNGDSNLDEINANAQPGWTEGENNTIYYKNGSTVPGQLPPSITSLDPGTCTDADNDTDYAESGCGTPVDCNDSDPAINRRLHRWN